MRRFLSSVSTLIPPFKLLASTLKPLERRPESGWRVSRQIVAGASRSESDLHPPVGRLRPGPPTSPSAAGGSFLQIGATTFAIDGTKILANASKHSAVSYGHAVKQIQLAEEQIAELLQKAENADSTPLQDGLTIPGEIKRREDRIAELREAKASEMQKSQGHCDQQPWDWFEVREWIY